MRNILFSLSFASVLLLTGCGDERQTMKVTQDKRGHAYIPEGAGSGSALGNVRVAGPDEQYITTTAKDTLTSLAKQYNTTLEWIITRNDLKAGLPAPGSNLIVPKR
jgi:LysM repeat protein